MPVPRRSSATATSSPRWVAALVGVWAVAGVVVLLVAVVAAVLGVVATAARLWCRWWWTATRSRPRRFTRTAICPTITAAWSALATTFTAPARGAWSAWISRP